MEALADTIGLRALQTNICQAIADGAVKIRGKLERHVLRRVVYPAIVTCAPVTCNVMGDDPTLQVTIEARYSLIVRTTLEVGRASPPPEPFTCFKIVSS